MTQIVHALAAKAYAAIQSDLPGLPPFDQLPEAVQASWQTALVHSQLFQETPHLAQPPDGGFGSLKSAWTVQAGVIPGDPLPELKRNWIMTAHDYANPPLGNRFSWNTIESVHYAQRLVNPSRLNWVRLDWVWY